MQLKLEMMILLQKYIFRYSCSANCCQLHKNSECEPPTLAPSSEQLESKNSEKYEFPTEDTVPLEKLELLETSQDIKQCLQNPHVRDIIKEIFDHPRPQEMIDIAMREPIFLELADACLKLIEPSN